MSLFRILHLEMNKAFYSFAVLVNALVAIVTICEAWLRFRLGNDMFHLPFYSTWLMGGVIFSIAQAWVVLKYFKSRNYSAALRTGLVHSVLVVLLGLTNYSLMELAFGVSFYVPLSILTLLVQIAFGLTLIFSATKERIWLRLAGGGVALVAIVSFVLTFVVLSAQFIEYHEAIQNFHGPILLISVLPPVMLVINFYLERSQQNEDNSDAFIFASPLLLVALLFFVFSIVREANQANPQESEKFLKGIAEPYEAREFVDGSREVLKYRLLKPLDYDSTKSYPIVVCLHGSSGTGEDNYRQVATSLFPAMLNTPENRVKYQSFIFVPQCSFGTSWGGHPLPGIEKKVFEAMASLEKEFPIDTSRRYVAGISLGGYGTWNFISKRPDLFAAAVPVCGGGDPGLASKCVDVPVWAFHGAHDQRVPVSGSRDMIEALRAAGGDPKYTEYPDKDHYIAEEVMKAEGLLDWMFAQKKP